MVETEALVKLHHRAVLGEELSPDEQRQLRLWYEAQDETERNSFNLAADDKELESLQTDVEAALARLKIETKRVEDLTAQNEKLRCENKVLREHLAKRGLLQTV